MKLTNLSRIIIIHIILVFSAPIQLKSQNPLKILPLGNSITFDQLAIDLRPIGERISYRYRLYQLLNAENYTYDFIGSEQSGGNYLPAGFTDNAGFPGITAAQLLTLLQTGRNYKIDPVNGFCELPSCNQSYLAYYQPDIILLHIGTNDITDSASAPGAVSAVASILDFIDAYETSIGKTIPVFLAQIINRAGSNAAGNHQPTSYFNQLLAAMVASRTSDVIRLVNKETGAGINYRYSPPGEMADLLHPVTAGYNKMATAWTNALKLYNYTAPIVSAIPNQTVPEGTPFPTINLNNYVFDPQESNANITWTYSVPVNLNISISPAKIATITVKDSEWNGSETITFTASDGGNGGPSLSGSTNVTFTVTPVNDYPVLANIGAGITYLEGDGQKIITSSITVTDIDNTNLTGAVVRISSGYTSAEDYLRFNTLHGITGSFSNGRLVLFGSATVVNYQAALRSIAYENTNTANPSSASRTVSFRVFDGADSSNVVTKNITVTPVNDAPEIKNIEAFPISYTEGQSPVVISSALTIEDVDNDMLSSATIRIDQNAVANEDTLRYPVKIGNITGVYTPATFTMTLTGIDTKANYQAAIRSVLYENRDILDPVIALRRISIVVNDGALSSAAVYRYVSITAVNHPPVANNVIISGVKQIFVPNIVNYNYIDPENDLEGATRFRWLRSASAAGTNPDTIAGAVSKTYILQYPDGGNYIRATVKPADIYGAISPIQYLSPWYYVDAAPVASNVTISGDIGIGQTVTINFSYFDKEDAAKGAHKYFWYRADNLAGTINKTLIGESNTYTIDATSNAKYISCAVAPVALTGSLIGDTVQTPWFGPIGNLPSATISGNDTLCPGEMASVRIALTGASPWSVTYTVNNINSVIIPKIVGSDTTLITNKPGTYRLTKVSDAKYSNGIVNGAANIGLHDSVKVTLSAVGSTVICDDGVSTANLRATFTGTSPWRFTLRINTTDTVYTGVTQNPFNFSTKKPGDYNILSASDKFCTSHTGSKDTIRVAPNLSSPVAVISGIDTVCPGDTARLTVTLTKGTTPWGFTYTLNDANAKTISNITSSVYTLKVVGAGVYKVTLVSNSQCTGKATGTGRVVYRSAPSATLSGGGTICQGTSATLKADLTGSAPWSFSYKRGTAIIDTFKNIQSSPRNFTVKNAGTYTLGMVSDKYCKGAVSGTVTVSVISAPVVAISGLKQTYSIDNGPVPIFGTPVGGIFTGSGLIFSQDTMFFLPAWAGHINSPHKITYTYQDQLSGCFGKDTVMVNVLAVEAEIKFPNDKVFYCYNDAPFVIIGANTVNDTGTFSITGGVGLTDNGDNSATIDPSKLIGGEYFVTYKYIKDNTLLSLTEKFDLEYVNPISFSGFTNRPYCTGENPLRLYGTVDPYGVFYGKSVTGNASSGFYFIPGLASIGSDTLFYSYTTVKGCSRIVQEIVTINESPKISFTVLDTCVSGGLNDSTRFVNNTTSTDQITGWLWNFDDISSGINNTSTLQSPKHLYASSGRRYVTLAASTVKGCTAQKETRFNFGDKPRAALDWETECYNAGSAIKFLDKSSLNVGEIDTYKWKFYLDESYDSLSVKNPDYSFSTPGDYRIVLEVKSNYGCVDTASVIFHLRPTIRLSEGSYIEDFETGANGWVALKGDNSLTNSWNLGQPTEGFIGAASGINSWYTQITNNMAENSWISSPCFDFTGVKKPMIKFDMWRIFEQLRDGAVLQYRFNNQDTWNNIGEIDDGKNWYKEYAIEGKPGNQFVGWSNIKDTRWMEARHNLNRLVGLTDVQFRLAYGSNGTGTTNKGIAIDNIGIWEREKIVLLEHFTNSSDLLCKDANEQVWSAINTLNGDVLDIQYHTSFPGADPFNTHNPMVSSARVFYYGILGVPYTFLDGGASSAHKYDYNLKPLNTNDINIQSLNDPWFSLEISSQIQNNSINLNASVIAEQAISSRELTLHTLIIERKITAVESAHGEKVFRNVVKAMLPNAAGTYIYKNWVPGSMENVSYSWNFSNVFDVDELRAVIFIQDESTKEIYQAAIDKFDFPSSIDDNFLTGQEFKCMVYPNPASDFAYIRLNQSVAHNLRLDIFDGSGRVVDIKTIEAFTEEVTLDTYHYNKGIYFIRLTDNKEINLLLKLIIIR